MRWSAAFRAGRAGLPIVATGRKGQWVDLEKFTASPSVILPPINVMLRHLNPLFTTLAPIPVVLERASALQVPVAKNGVAPPPP